MTKIAWCRLDSCDNEQTFRSIQACQESDWTEFALVSVHTEDGDRISAFCPGHSLDGD